MVQNRLLCCKYIQSFVYNSCNLSSKAWYHCNSIYLWYDRWKPITCRKIDILSYWYHEKVWIIFFPELFTWISSDTGIKSYRCSKAIKNKEKHYNFYVNFLYFAVLPFATCDRFSQITSHIGCTFYMLVHQHRLALCTVWSVRNNLMANLIGLGKAQLNKELKWMMHIPY